MRNAKDLPEFDASPASGLGVGIAKAIGEGVLALEIANSLDEPYPLEISHPAQALDKRNIRLSGYSCQGHWTICCRRKDFRIFVIECGERVTSLAVGE